MPTAPSSTPTTDSQAQTPEEKTLAEIKKVTDFITQKNTDDIAGNTRVGEALESLRTTTAEIPKVVTQGADKQAEATKLVGTNLVKEVREQAAGSERLAAELRSALKEMHVEGLHHTQEHVGHKLQALTEQLKWTAIPTAGATRASTEVPVQGVVGANSNPPNITPLTTKKDSSHAPPKPTPQVPRPQDNDRIPPHRDAAD